MKLNDIFPDVFVINLDHRTDRLADINYMAEQQGWRFKRWPATNSLDLSINGVNMEENERRRAELACKISHARVISAAKRMGLEKVLILEDDAVLNGDRFDMLQEALNEVEDVDQNWQLFYLGANDINNTKERVGFVSYRIFTPYTTHAYCIHERAYDNVLLALYNRGQVDVLYSEFIASQGHSYTVYPYIAEQKNGISDITGITEKYTLK